MNNPDQTPTPAVAQERPTPRTDQYISELQKEPEMSGCNRTLGFARQLERELAEANEKNASQAEENERLRAAMEEIAEDAYLPNDPPARHARCVDIAREALSAPSGQRMVRREVLEEARKYIEDQYCYCDFEKHGCARCLSIKDIDAELDRTKEAK
jgi:hypothetical protein